MQENTILIYRCTHFYCIFGFSKETHLKISSLKSADIDELVGVRNKHYRVFRNTYFYSWHKISLLYFRTASSCLKCFASKHVLGNFNSIRALISLPVRRGFLKALPKYLRDEPAEISSELIPDSMLL